LASLAFPFPLHFYFVLLASWRSAGPKRRSIKPSASALLHGCVGVKDKVFPLLFCFLFSNFASWLPKRRNCRHCHFCWSCFFLSPVAHLIPIDTPTEQKQWHCRLFLFLFFFLLLGVRLDRRDDQSNCRHRLFVGCVGVKNKVSPLICCSLSSNFASCLPKRRNRRRRHFSWSCFFLFLVACLIPIE